MKPFSVVILIVLFSNVSVAQANAQAMNSKNILCPMTDKYLSLSKIIPKHVSELKQRIFIPSIQEKIMFIYKQQTENHKTVNRLLLHIRRF